MVPFFHTLFTPFSHDFHTHSPSSVSKSCDVGSGTRDFSLSLNLIENKSRYFCTILDNAGNMCCSEMWKHQRRGEWNGIGTTCPQRLRRRKKWIDFVLERRKMWTPGRPRPCARCTSMTRTSQG